MIYTLLFIIIIVIVISNSSTKAKKRMNSTKPGFSIPLVKCHSCGKEISASANLCQHCGHPMTPSACPKCGTRTINGISNLDKSLSMSFWGVGASKTANNSFKCDSCGFKF